MAGSRDNTDTASLVYLDHAAATPVLPEVVAAHGELCRRFIANPHASSWLSAESSRAVHNAGVRLLHLLGVPEGAAEVIWTSGGTEAVNLACLGFLRAADVKVCAVDATAHAAALESCRHWGRGQGACCEMPVRKDGRLDPAGAGFAADRMPQLLVVAHVNNETGAVQDLARLRSWMTTACAHACLAVDGIQSFGKIAIPWQEAGIDLLAVSGRKIGGPASVGALVRRNDVPLKPLILGGGQQKGLRAGTLDVVGIMEFVEAAEIACARRTETFDLVAALNRSLRERLESSITPAPTVISPASASPYILSVAFPGYEAAVLVRLLAERRVIAGAGSACSAASAKPSHVLKAMGFADDVIRGTLRISFGASSSMRDVEAFTRELAEVMAEY